MRTIAVDWSGAVANDGAKGIAIAVAEEGVLTDIIPGPSHATPKGRKEAIEYLLNQRAECGEELIVGLDFAFSLPAWYLKEKGFRDAPALWEHAHSQGEGWWEAEGSRTTTPFWRADKAGKPDFEGKAELRSTEQDPAIKKLAGSSPRSAFQLSGAGSVGSSTVRGLPRLHELREAGFNIWPWDAPKAPLVLEVWPRIAVGGSTKSSPTERVKVIKKLVDSKRLSTDVAMYACADDNAFDAVLTALWLACHSEEILATTTDEGPSREGSDFAREGRIWTPSETKQVAGKTPAG